MAAEAPGEVKPHARVIAFLQVPRHAVGTDDILSEEIESERCVEPAISAVGEVGPTGPRPILVFGVVFCGRIRANSILRPPHAS